MATQHASRGHAPGSPSSQTQYSLDLEALNLDDTNGSLSPLPKPRFDKIASDDIDGPSDFTINMGKWLKDAPPKRAKIDSWSFDPLKDDAEDCQPKDDVRNGVLEQGYADDRSSVQDDVLPQEVGHVSNVSFDSVSETGAHQNDRDENTQQTHVGSQGQSYADSEDASRENSTLLDLDMTNGSTTPRQPEESSIWEPQHNSSSLRFSRARRFLQPTVEDYNSELTPARPVSAMNLPTFSITPDPPRRAASASKIPPSSPGKPSSPTLSPVRSPVIHRKENTLDSASSEWQRMRLEIEEARVEQAKTQAELEQARTQLEEEHLRNTDLQSALQRANDNQRTVGQAGDNANQDLRREIEDLEDELNGAQRAEQDALDVAEERRKALDDARRAEQGAIRLAEDRAKELTQMHESEDAELQNMRWQLQQAQDSEQVANTSLGDLRRQMEDQGRAHDEEVQRLGRDLAAARNDARSAIETEQTAQDELRLLRQQRNEHATALRDETQRLRQELDEAHRQEESARSEADRYYAELEQIKTARESTLDTTQDATGIATHEEAVRRADELRQTLEKQLRDAEAQVAEIVQEREAERDVKDKQLFEAQARILALTRDVNDAEKAASATEDNLHEVQTKLAALTQEIKAEEEAKTKQLGDAVAQAKSLTTQLNNDQKVKDDELREVQAQIISLTQARKADQEASESQLRQVKEQIAKLARQREADRDSKKKQLSDAQVQIETVTREREVDMGTKEKQLCDAQAQLVIITEEHKTEQEARQKAEDEVRSLKEEIGFMQDLKKLDEEAPDLPPKEFEQLNAGYDKALKLADSLRADMEMMKQQMKIEKKQHDAEMRSMRTSLETQKETDALLLAEEKNEHRRTIDLIEEGMASLRHDRASLAAQVTALEQDFEMARSGRPRVQKNFKEAQKHLDRARPDAGLAQEDVGDAQEDAKKARDDAEKAREEAAKAREETVKAQKDNAKTQKDIERLQKDIENMKDVNKAYDVRLAEIMKKRDDAWRVKVKEQITKVKEAQKEKRHWEDKVDVLEEEKELMSKALMIEWGKQEQGVEEGAKKQKYVYKYGRTQRKAGASTQSKDGPTKAGSARSAP